MDRHVCRCTKLSLWEPTVDLGVFSRNKVGRRNNKKWANTYIIYVYRKIWRWIDMYIDAPSSRSGSPRWISVFSAATKVGIE
jgi:hypothetical protein